MMKNRDKDLMNAMDGRRKGGNKGGKVESEAAKEARKGNATSVPLKDAGLVEKKATTERIANNGRESLIKTAVLQKGIKEQKTELTPSGTLGKPPNNMGVIPSN